VVFDGVVVVLVSFQVFDCFACLFESSSWSGEPAHSALHSFNEVVFVFVVSLCYCMFYGSAVCLSDGLDVRERSVSDSFIVWLGRVLQ